MKNKINISIPQPCHENWQLMTPSEKGKFCISCQKNVYDFTKFSDREIADAFNRQGNLCGRFNTSQLNRDLVIPREKNTIWLSAASIIFSFIGLGSQQTHSQGAHSNKPAKSNIHRNKELISSNNTIQVSGIVYNDENSPLTNVHINVGGKIFLTDAKGNFSIKANKGELFEFSVDEYNTEIFQFNESRGHLSIMLTRIIERKKAQYIESESLIVGSIAIQSVPVKSTFLGRVFYSIGSVFRQKQNEE